MEKNIHITNFDEALQFRVDDPCRKPIYFIIFTVLAMTSLENVIWRTAQVNKERTKTVKIIKNEKKTRSEKLPS